MESLGISQSSLEENESIDVEAEGTEAEAETNEASEGEAVEAKGEDVTEDVDSAEKPEGEEAKEAPAEEPKQAAENQEVEALKLKYAEEQKALTEERTKFQAEMAELKEKFQEKIKTHDEFDAFFIDLEAKDPDLYGLVKSAFHEHARQYNNPVVANLRQEMAKISEELKSFKTQATAEVTLNSLQSERQKLAGGLGKDAEAAGIKLDYSKIDQKWASLPEGTTYEEAAFMLYGPTLIKASASKAKVEAVTKKVQSQPSVKTAGAVKSSSRPANAPVPKNTFDAVHYFAKQVTGKAVG
jgi:hypothetical protein